MIPPVDAGRSTEQHFLPGLVHLVQIKEFLRGVEIFMIFYSWRKRMGIEPTHEASHPVHRI